MATCQPRAASRALRPRNGRGLTAPSTAPRGSAAGRRTSSSGWSRRRRRHRPPQPRPDRRRGAGRRRGPRGRQLLALLRRQLPERRPLDPGRRRAYHSIDVNDPVSSSELRDGDPIGPRRRPRPPRRRGRSPRGACSRPTSWRGSWTTSGGASTRRCTTSPRTRWPTSARRASCSRARSTSPAREPSSATATC